MKNTKHILSYLFLLIIGITGLYAQETIPASGGEATGTGGSVSYTVGQVFYTTMVGTNGSVVQGVQQPYEISIISEIKKAKDINLACSAYPNPTTDLLTLKMEGYKTDNLNYQLFDMNGKPLENKKINGNETTISLEKYQPGTYFLKVIDKNNEIKTFKIIKTK